VRFFEALDHYMVSATVIRVGHVSSGVSGTPTQKPGAGPGYPNQELKGGESFMIFTLTVTIVAVIVTVTITVEFRRRKRKR